MKIQYWGHSCFKITSAENVSIITDPYTKVGYELPDGLTADMVTVSHGHFDHNHLAAIGGQPKIITQTTLVHGVAIQAISTWHDPQQGKLRGANNVYLFTLDQITVCHLGDLGEANNDALIERLNGIDVLMIPIGGTYTIDAKQAKQYIEAISPKIVIPMHYKPIDGALDISDEKEFLSLFSQETIITCKGECNLTKDRLPNNGTQIIFMERAQQ